MGNNQKQPCENIDLFIEVSKNFYESGELIKGKINLNIKTDQIPYEKMTLKFYCA